MIVKKIPPSQQVKPERKEGKNAKQYNKITIFSDEGELPALHPHT